MLHDNMTNAVLQAARAASMTTLHAFLRPGWGLMKIQSQASPSWCAPTWQHMYPLIADALHYSRSPTPACNCWPACRRKQWIALYQALSAAGSLHTVLGPHHLDCGHTDQPTMKALQCSHRPGWVDVEVLADRGKVKIGGHACIVLEGQLLV